jgi:hypothetical protein
MVRPKTSARNQDIGVEFATMVTQNSSNKEEVDPPLYCIGSMSIFRLFSAMIPNLCRDLIEKNPGNRQGLSVIELNKALKKIGWKSIRKQRTVSGERQRPMVSLCIDVKYVFHCNSQSCCQVWIGKRWVDTKNSEDAAILSTRLEKLHSRYPETRSCSFDRIQENMSNHFRNWKDNSSLPDEQTNVASHRSANSNKRGSIQVIDIRFCLQHFAFNGISETCPLKLCNSHKPKDRV